jgi:hypothetical protein
VAIVPAPVAAPPGVALLRLDPPAMFPVIAAWRRWNARSLVERFVTTAGSAIA